MAKVKDVFPDVPILGFNTEWAKGATLADIWAQYDEETDSMLIYVTGKPVPGVNVYLTDGIYAIVDVHDGNKLVGLYFEAWEEYVPKQEFVQRSWKEVRETAMSNTDGSLSLRLLALSMIMMIGTENTPARQLA